MARIAGVDIPNNKRGIISLTYIFGIGNSSAKNILDRAGLDEHKKVQDWTDEEAQKVRDIISSEFKTEGVLKIRSTNEYQAFARHWLLPRFETQKRSSSKGTTHKKQLSN